MAELLPLSVPGIPESLPDFLLVQTGAGGPTRITLEYWEPEPGPDPVTALTESLRVELAVVVAVRATHEEYALGASTGLDAWTKDGAVPPIAVVRDSPWLARLREDEVYMDVNAEGCVHLVFSSGEDVVDVFVDTAVDMVVSGVDMVVGGQKFGLGDLIAKAIEAHGT